MKQQLLFKNAMSKLLVLSCFLLFNLSFGQGRIFYSRATGNWNSNNTWSTTLIASSGLGSTAVPAGSVEGTNFPGPDDTVYITGNHTININISNARCKNLFVGSTSGGTGGTVYPAVVTYTGQINFGGAATSGNFGLKITENLTVLTSNLATASTSIMSRILNVYKNDLAIVATLDVDGDIVVGNSTDGYIDALIGTSSDIRRLNYINFGTVNVSTGALIKYGPTVNVLGNVNLFSHQVPGRVNFANERYNLSSVNLNSGKMTLSGTEIMTAGSEETTGKGYIKTFRKGSSDGRDAGNRFVMAYSEASATLELNHHTDSPFYTAVYSGGSLAVNFPQIQQGIIIYKSTSGNPSKVFPTVYRDLTIDNASGASIDEFTSAPNLKVNNFLTLASGTLNAGGTSVLDIGGAVNSGFKLYMKGGELTQEADANFIISNKISIIYSDNATVSGIELTKAMGTGAGFTDNKIDELILDPGTAAFDFTFSDIEAGVIRFRRPDYQLTAGNFYAQTFIELAGNNAEYNGCVFITPRLDITANSYILSNQTIRTTTGSTFATYTSSGRVNLGDPANGITVYLGANLTTTDCYMNGLVTLSRPSGVENTYFNVHGFFKVGDNLDYDLISNGVLTLKSLAYETARVSKQDPSFQGEIIGDVNVERFLQNDGGDGNGRFWRLLTVPVTKLNSSDDASIWKHWQNNGVPYALGDNGYGTDVWGSNSSYTIANNGMYYLNPGTHNFRKYVSSNGATGGWVNVSNTRTEELFTSSNNNAFLAFIIKPFGQGVTVTEGEPNTSSPGSVSTILSATGKLKFGTVTYTISKNRYHLIGNPYASPIIFGPILSSNNTKIETKIWVLDSKMGDFGGYVTSDGSTWSDPGSLHGGNSGQSTPSTTIQSGEGFFIKTTNIATPTTTINIVDGYKNETVSSSSIFGRTAQTNDSFELMRVLLKKVTNNVTTHEDGSTAKFYAGGVNEVDESDAEKFSNPTGTISLINGTTRLAIEHRATVVAGDEIFINVSNAAAGTDYKLHIYTENFSFSGVATLHDLKLGTTTQMPIDGSVFEYPFTVTSDATTQGTRFKIVFSNSALSVDDVVTNSIRLYPNPVSKSGSLNINLGALENMVYNYRIVNMLGQTIQTGKLDKTDLNQEFSLTFNTAFSAGLYTIEVLDQNKVVGTSKIIIK